MDKATDFESAVIRINDAMQALEEIALTNRLEGGKILEFLLSFNPSICDQSDLSIKVGALRILNEQCKPHARIILEQSISSEIPVWTTYRDRIKKILYI